jgi:hypothetical protein
MRNREAMDKGEQTVYFAHSSGYFAVHCELLCPIRSPDTSPGTRAISTGPRSDDRGLPSMRVHGTGARHALHRFVSRAHLPPWPRALCISARKASSSTRRLSKASSPRCSIPAKSITQTIMRCCTSAKRSTRNWKPLCIGAVTSLTSDCAWLYCDTQQLAGGQAGHQPAVSVCLRAIS